MKYYPMFDLFDDFFTGNTTSDVMKTDIVEKDGNYEMSMELPGVKKEDIQMELKDGYLKVSATHGSNTEDKDEKGRVVRKERVSGSYSRSFYVGEGIHQEDVKASFDNGELKIVVPKEAPKQIAFILEYFPSQSTTVLWVLRLVWQQIFHLIIYQKRFKPFLR